MWGHRARELPRERDGTGAFGAGWTSVSAMIADKIRKDRVDYNNNPPLPSSLCLLLLVRPGRYTVNL